MAMELTTLRVAAHSPRSPASGATILRISAGFLLLGLTLLHTTAGATQGDRGRDLPPIPYEDHGACPFECCTYRAWTVKTDTDLRVDCTDTASLVVRLRKGDRVTGTTGVVVTTRLGKARVLAPITKGATRLRLEVGQTLYVLNYVGEGAWRLWFKGNVYLAENARGVDDCTGPAHDTVLCPVQIVEEPAYVWWAKVRAPNGKEGWTRQMDHFGNIDACG